ncbi:hypothetical protein B0H14DRAFT_3725721 [Mycena olivaceomarginata]|nr:hypothetical protein B0H14DRAFT_3725721 [Mycena olivaceomarginata]
MTYKIVSAGIFVLLIASKTPQRSTFNLQVQPLAGISDHRRKPPAFSAFWALAPQGSPSTVHVAADISPVSHIALHLPRIVCGAIQVATHLPSSRTSPYFVASTLKVVYAPVHVLRVPHVTAHLLHNVYGAPHMGHATVHVLSAVNIAMHAPSSKTSPCVPSKLYTPRYTSSASHTSPPTSFTMCTHRSCRRACPLVAHIATGTLHVLCTHALRAVRVTAHVPLSRTSPCVASTLYTPPAHVLRIPHLAAYLPCGVRGAEHVPHIVHKGVHDSRFAHAPRHVTVHLPSVVMHGSGFVLVAAHVPCPSCARTPYIFLHTVILMQMQQRVQQYCNCKRNPRANAPNTRTSQAHLCPMRRSHGRRRTPHPPAAGRSVPLWSPSHVFQVPAHAQQQQQQQQRPVEFKRSASAMGVYHAHEHEDHPRAPLRGFQAQCVCDRDARERKHNGVGKRGREQPDCAGGGQRHCARRASIGFGAHAGAAFARGTPPPQPTGFWRCLGQQILLVQVREKIRRKTKPQLHCTQCGVCGVWSGCGMGRGQDSVQREEQERVKESKKAERESRHMSEGRKRTPLSDVFRLVALVICCEWGEWGECGGAADVDGGGGDAGWAWVYPPHSLCSLHAHTHAPDLPPLHALSGPLH